MQHVQDRKPEGLQLPRILQELYRVLQTGKGKEWFKGGRRMIVFMTSMILAAISGACFIAAYELDYRQQRAEVLRIKKKAARAYDRGYDRGWRDGRW